MKTNESILSNRAAAAFLGVHFQTLRRWVQKKQVPHIKYPNGQIKCRREDLVLWLETKTVVPVEVEHLTTRRKRRQEEIEKEKVHRIANEMLARHYTGKKRSLLKH